MRRSTVTPDPINWPGLVFRIVDDPARAFCALAVSYPVLMATTLLVSPAAGPAVWANAGGGVVLLLLVRFVLRRQQAARARAQQHHGRGGRAGVSALLGREGRANSKT
ncbi:MAG: hypothetical protein QOJ20_2745 [Mycobacterium sp.]|nr:hypothetical protein [Mycobacterium sp.]